MNDFDSLVDEMLSTAITSFHSTEQYKLLHEKLERMDSDCHSMFTSDEREFASECFDLVTEVSGAQQRYIYQQGLRDCVNILKGLGVLA